MKNLKNILLEIEKVEAFSEKLDFYEIFINKNKNNIRIINKNNCEFYYEIIENNNNEIIVKAMYENEIDFQNFYFSEIKLNLNNFAKTLNEIFSH